MPANVFNLQQDTIPVCQGSGMDAARFLVPQRAHMQGPHQLSQFGRRRLERRLQWFVTLRQIREGDAPPRNLR